MQWMERSKALSKFKIVFIVLLVVGVAGAAGYFAAVQYQQLRVVMQQRQDQKDAETRAKIEAREQKELAENAERWKVRAEADKKAGTAENPDQVIRGLTADMKMEQTEDGGTRYAYEMPTEDGIYLQPYIIQNGNGVQLYITVSHLGQRPMGFHGIVVQTSKKEAYQIEAAVPVETYDRKEGGIIETFDQPADAYALRAMREVAYGLGGKIFMAGVSGSNDDRGIAGREAMEIKDMVDLYDILSGRKKSIDEGNSSPDQ